MKKGDTNWFRPLWRRVAVTGVVAAWCLFEWIVSRDQLWSMLTTGLLAYALYSFFYAFPKEKPEDDSDKSQG